MKRRTFIQKMALAAAAGLTFSLNRLFGEESRIALALGVPQPPQPPKPQAPVPIREPDPPHAIEMPSIPFDAPPGTWTLVVLPDTQNMSASYPEVYYRQTEWIVAHQKRHNIIFVAHEGDLVDWSTSQAQWSHAQQAMRTLTAAGIPYCLLPGNHDVGNPDFGIVNRSTLLNDYFSVEDYRHSEAMGLFEPGKMENSWHTFTAPTGQYLIVALEYAPRDEAVAWADQIVAERPDHKVILLTHSYTYFDNTRYDWKRYHDGQQWAFGDFPLLKRSNDGQQIWNKLVRKHPHIFLVLSGHVLDKGTGYFVSKSDHGQRVHQILANYQALVEPHRPFFGGGYLRLMQFYPDGQMVQVRSYSPWLDDWLVTPDQQFRFII